jgi:tRNA(Ile)-lysidine synthase
LARSRGSEEAARRARHKLLSAAARQAGCGRIALGHTMDDQAETVLMRLIRGTGRRGLSGMRRCGPGLLIRPLLGVRREALRIYLKELGQGFREDETNLEARFLRNRLRTRLLPVLAELNPAIVESLARTAELLEGEDRYLDDLARREVTRWARPGPAGAEASVRIPAANLNAMPLPLRRRAARMLLAQAGGDPRGAPSKAVADLIDLAGRERPGGGVDLPGGVRASRQEGLLILGRADAAFRAAGRNLPAPFCVDMQVPGEVALPGGRGILRSRRLDPAELAPRLEAARRAGELDTRRVFMDAAALGGAPCVRSRLRGDAFRPMGGAGSRKVGDYLIDRKVPRARRDQVPLVVGTAGIAWVVGFRAAEEYRVTPKSRDVVELEWDRGEGWLD